MKTFFYILLVPVFILSSCSSGNFAKRKYTKGKYKSEKSDYKIAKNNKKSVDTKYVSKTEKNKFKQKYKINNSKTSKKEVTNNSNEVAVNTSTTKNIEANNKEVSYNHHTVITDDLTVEENIVLNDNVIITEESAPVEPSPSPDAGMIISFVALGIGIVAFVLACIGFMGLAMSWTAMGLGIIATILGTVGKYMDGNAAAGWGIALGVLAIIISLIFILLLLGGII